MFSRWTQENFFKYLRENYDMDRMIQYSVEQIDKDFRVVNPVYSRLSYDIKKVREKISRRRAHLYIKENEQNNDADIVKTPAYLLKLTKIKAELDDLLEEEKQLIEQRKSKSYKITIEEMVEEQRYNSLKTETK